MNYIYFQNYQSEEDPLLIKCSYFNIALAQIQNSLVIPPINWYNWCSLLIYFDLKNMKMSYSYPLLNILYVFFKNPALILFIKSIFFTWARL